MTDQLAVANPDDAEELEHQLIALEGERREALVADDPDRLARLLAEDLVHVHTTGVVHNKQELLEHAGTFLAYLNVERSNLQVRRLSSEAAVMTGMMTNTIRFRASGETAVVQAYVTQVWVLRDKRWQIASFQATRLPASAPKA